MAFEKGNFFPVLDRGPKWLREYTQKLTDTIYRDRINNSGEIEFEETQYGRFPNITIPEEGDPLLSKPKPFELRLEMDPNDESELKLRVYPSTLAGGSSLDIGFSEGDDPPYFLDLQKGVLQGGISVGENGEITDRWLEIKTELSVNTESNYYVEIGTVGQTSAGTWRVSNSLYGPLWVDLCVPTFGGGTA